MRPPLIVRPLSFCIFLLNQYKWPGLNCKTACHLIPQNWWFGCGLKWKGPLYLQSHSVINAPVLVDMSIYLFTPRLLTARHVLHHILLPRCIVLFWQFIHKKYTYCTLNNVNSYQEIAMMNLTVWLIRINCGYSYQLRHAMGTHNYFFSC